ncbi:MAG: sortase [Micrococcales bacterium]
MFKSSFVKPAGACVAAFALAISLQASGASAATHSAPKTAISSSALAIKAGAIIGKLYVPRYGKSYHRTIAEGTDPNVLYGPGLGHYVGTEMPGDLGNFAIAGHRLANGGPMKNIDKLRVGDLAFVLTNKTWYEYTFLAGTIVKPTNVGVIYPQPEGLDGANLDGHYMTFTSCTPPHVNTKRIVAWFSLKATYPVSAGTPADLKAALKKAK